MSLSIVEIPESKNYWLIRTNGGKYYSEYRVGKFIGINWDLISLSDIQKLNNNDLRSLVKKQYPEKRSPGRAASQLKIFDKEIQKGDTVVITSTASNKFSIGTIIDEQAYEEYISQKLLEEDSKKCPYKKRKKVNWLNEVSKMDVDRPMFKLLQHARNTINNANEYADTIESLVHDFYVRGNQAQLTLQVKKEEDIPALAFYSLGAELLELVNEFAKEYSYSEVDVNKIITKVNMNSKGNFKLKGSHITMIVIAGMLMVFIAGGGGTFKVGENEFSIETNSIIPQITEFLNEKQDRENKELILKKYINQLEIKTPNEFKENVSEISDFKYNEDGQE
ncbi:hypothetical protein KC285_13595 [Listeria monocytogenes]|uniref:hypothetical protein n=1 Tax=Listeria monocytogenes TaxID=1639 RepID=UPI0010DAB7AB|nr:hypothetical protein [Listeria monocytogenes]EAD8875352.1 hypothetical protein [Listeria monocytogenes]EAF4145643.1 hypothetical protein [Listeria monocytogenes]EAG1849147.1 hypothetical protein [Listeria monocytogenes]EDN9677954.1 hypothetical protein [Listeria monocytogenes]EED2346132.1 hypothetical protein [Listeria monocytogenes]